MGDKLITLASSDFELFGVPARFAQDRAALDTSWKELQHEAHPDKFAVHGAAAQRQAMQWSVRINEAYQRLKDPLKRAAYLCELSGAAINAESNTAMPAQFLMQQMAWREALDEAALAADIDVLRTQVLEARRAALALCEQLLDMQHDALGAVAHVRALMFIERFCSDLDARTEYFESLPAVSTGSRP